MEMDNIEFTPFAIVFFRFFSLSLHIIQFHNENICNWENCWCLDSFGFLFICIRKINWLANICTLIHANKARKDNELHSNHPTSHRSEKFDAWQRIEIEFSGCCMPLPCMLLVMVVAECAWASVMQWSKMCACYFLAIFMRKRESKRKAATKNWLYNDNFKHASVWKTHKKLPQ